MTAQNSFFTTLDSPVGELLLTSEDDQLTGLYFEAHRQPPNKSVDMCWYDRITQTSLREDSLFEEVTTQLHEYFAGSRTTFHLSSLTLSPRGTPFQERVWAELCKIPYGETISYGELATRIGQPTASRAVGMANGRNPISIIVPCHRVIGGNGKLVGYGGGLERKQMLLAIEREHDVSLAVESLFATEGID